MKQAKEKTKETQPKEAAATEAKPKENKPTETKPKVIKPSFYDKPEPDTTRRASRADGNMDESKPPCKKYG